MRAYTAESSAKWLPRTAPRVIRRTTASQPQPGRHDHVPPQKGSGTCQANRRCDCFGAAMVIAVTSPLVIGVVSAVGLAALVFSCFQSGRAILWMAPSS